MKRGSLGDELFHTYQEQKTKSQKDELTSLEKELPNPLPFSTSESIEIAIQYMEKELKDAIHIGYKSFIFMADKYFKADTANFPGWDTKYTEISPKAFMLLAKKSLKPLFDAFIKKHSEMIVITKTESCRQSGCIARFTEPEHRLDMKTDFYFQWS
jgi:hypothetical protein